MQQLLAGAVLPRIIEALRNDLLLGDLVELAHAVGEDAVAGGREPLVSGVVHIIEIVHDELDLVLVSYGGCEGLELQFFHLLYLAVTDTLNDGEEVLPVFWEDLLGSAIGVTLDELAYSKGLLLLHLLLVLEVLLYLVWILQLVLHC